MIETMGQFQEALDKSNLPNLPERSVSAGTIIDGQWRWLQIENVSQQDGGIVISLTEPPGERQKGE